MFRAGINVVRYEPHFVLIHDILKPFEFVAGFIVSDETFQTPRDLSGYER